MNNFIFNVSEIRGAGNHALISGKHYSGLIRFGEKVYFASRTGGIEHLADDVAYVKHSSAEMLVVNMSYSDTVYDAKDKGIWAVDDSNSSCMVVDDVFDIIGRGIVLTGVVAYGKICVGDNMNVVTPTGKVYFVVVSGIEYFRKLKETAYKGESVGVLLSGIRSKNDVPLGSLLCRPLTAPAYDGHSPEQDDMAFVVNDVFVLQDQRIVVDGYVHVSQLNVGDVMEFSSLDGKTHTVRVSSIAIQKRICDVARNGEYAGLLLGGINNNKEIPIGTQMYLKKVAHVNPPPYPQQAPNSKDQPDVKLNILSFIIPLVGFLLIELYKNDFPVMTESIKVSTGLGFIVNIIILCCFSCI